MLYTCVSRVTLEAAAAALADVESEVGAPRSGVYNLTGEPSPTLISAAEDVPIARVRGVVAGNEGGIAAPGTPGGARAPRSRTCIAPAATARSRPRRSGCRTRRDAGNALRDDSPPSQT